MQATPETNNVTSSLSQEPLPSPNFDYDIKGDERVISILVSKVQQMEKKINELETKKILDETQLPLELLEQNNLLPYPIKNFKTGKGYRPLLKSEIEDAKKHSIFAMAQARFLGVSFSTLRKYAKLYGIYTAHPNEKGKRNLFGPNKGRFPLNDILAGKFNDNPSVTDWMVKDKLIRSGIIPAKCNICGYDKRRIVDNKIYLLLDHKDGNLRNFKLDNLQLLCGNCTFECGRGYIRSGKHMFDIDWLQGARKQDLDEDSRW